MNNAKNSVLSLESRSKSYNNYMSNKCGFHLCRRLDREGQIYFIAQILKNPDNPSLGYVKSHSIHVPQISGKNGLSRMRHEAEEQAKAILSKEGSRLPSNDLKKYLLDFWADDSAFFINKAAEGSPVTPNHIDQSRMRVKKYFLPWAEMNGITRLDELSKKRMLDWRAWALAKVKEAGYQPNIVNMTKNALNLCFHHAETLDDLLFNPLCVLERRLKSESKEREPFTADDMKIMLAKKWPDDRCRIAAWLAFETGMRIGEIQGLKWENVDLKLLKIDIRFQYQENYERTFCLPKWRKERLDVPISSDLGKALDKMRLASAFPFSKIVFPDSSAIPISRYLLVQGLKAGLKFVGVDRKGRTWHCFRHGYVSETKARNGIELTSRAIGHSSISVTENYSHVTAQDMKRLRETVDGLVQGALV